jgi:hypothetical protein
MPSSEQVGSGLDRHAAGGRPGRQVAIALAGVLGAAVFVGAAYLLYAWMTRAPVPDVVTAAPMEIARFLGHPRGLARLSIAEREAFMVRLLTTDYEPDRRAELASALRQMTTREKEIRRDALWEVGYSALSKLAEEYRRTAPKDRVVFVDEKLAGYFRAKRELKAKHPAREGEPELLDRSWLDGLPTKKEGMVQLILERTTSEDRKRIGPYVEAVMARMAYLKRHPKEKARLLERYGVADPNAT